MNVDIGVLFLVEMVLFTITVVICCIILKGNKELSNWYGRIIRVFLKYSMTAMVVLNAIIMVTVISRGIKFLIGLF